MATESIGGGESISGSGMAFSLSRLTAILLIASVAPAMLVVGVMGVGSRGSFAATASIQGFVAGFGLSFALAKIGEYRSRLLVGSIAVGGIYLGAAFVLRHSGVENHSVIEALVFSTLQALMTFFVVAAETRPQHVAVGIVPLTIPILLVFFHKQLDLYIIGGVLGALLIVAVRRALHGKRPAA